MEIDWFSVCSTKLKRHAAPSRSENEKLEHKRYFFPSLIGSPRGTESSFMEGRGATGPESRGACRKSQSN